MPLNDSSGDNWGKIYAQSVNSVFKIVENKIGVKLCREGAVLPEVSKGNDGIDLRVLTKTENLKLR